MATTAVASASAKVTEAGSSLVYPLATIWSQHYTATSVSTASVGSGKGINDIQLGQVDIGASDAPMTSSQYAADHSGTPVQIPWALSATGVGYNIKGVGYGLKLNGTLLAEIFSGKVTSWGNKAIVKLNPKFKKALDAAGHISPIVRSDGSGDSYAFQHFLSVAAPKVWTYGYSTSWGSPVGTGENGNSGVAGEVRINSGSIGYISAYYLVNEHITTAAIENQAGNFEYPNPKNILDAAESNSKISGQGSGFTGVSIVNPGKKYKTAYPISTYTYAIVNTNDSNVSAVKGFLSWAVTTGQSYGVSLDFVPLPAGIRTADAGLINSL
ncbi:MAG TPA: phosphate ABC transporter substrate-binding protein PstS [Solirubrobacteraceae bacterium]|nr:phosphate ABC transporter substrate-binding protein PstS [Solirubrobacteraceae bacterium]